MSFLIEQAHASTVDTSAVDAIVKPILTNIVQPILGIVFVAAVAFFLYGVVEMVVKGGDADAREKGRNHMLYGVIGGAIMLSAWGIVYLISNTIKAI